LVGKLTEKWPLERTMCLDGMVALQLAGEGVYVNII